MPDDKFPQYPPATWQAKGKRAISFAVEQLQESGGNRLVPHERTRRNGAKYDDTGSKSVTYTIVSPFYTTCEDPGVSQDTLYPEDLNDLIESFTVHEVGDLTVPTRGKRRCRLESYQRTEASAERDHASVTFTFVEDNEDGVLASSFINPSARSTAVAVADAAEFSLEQQGIPSTDFGASLAELAAGIEALAGAPDEFMADLETKATQIRSATERIVDAFSSGSGGAGVLLLDPVASHVWRHTALLVDTTSRVVAEKLSHRPKLKTVTFKYVVGLPQVAAAHQQDFAALLAANPKIGNAFAISAGTPINVYVS